LPGARSFTSIVDADLDDFTIEADDRFQFFTVVLEIDLEYFLPLISFAIDFGYLGARIILQNDVADLALADGKGGASEQ
jgi:hypothetical protein